MKIQFVTIIFFILVVLTSGTMAQIETVEFGDAAKLVSRSFKEDNKERVFEISAEYPELEGLSPEANAKFNKMVKGSVMKIVDNFRSEMLEMDEEDLKFARERGFTNYSEIGYSVSLANRDLISLIFGNSTFTGGAHPNSYSFTVNYDLKNSKEMLLADLFLPDSNYLKVISEFAITDLNKQFDSENDEWIAEGAGPKAENFENWNIGSDGIRFSFDAYQVASYAAGPQEVLIAFGELRSVLKVSDLEPLKYANNGNSVNWCRNGLFPSDSEDFRIAKIIGIRNEKVFFYNDDDEKCPDKERCKTRSYLIPGDEVIVAKNYGNFACGWYWSKKGSNTVGWIAAEKLSIVETAPNATVKDWLGEWTFFDNSIFITDKKDGFVNVSGTAFWKGFGDNIHVGEVDSDALPSDGKLGFGGDGEYDCRVKMQRVGRFLIVSDNLNCGGMNVTFNGVYQKK